MAILFTQNGLYTPTLHAGPKAPRKTGMKQNHHATLQQGNNEPRSHGSEASQSVWQGNIAALRQSDSLPCFPASENPIDAVLENRFTYGKAGKVKWAYKNAEGKRGDRVTSQSERLDKQQDSKWVKEYMPKCESVVVQRDLVTGRTCSRVTWQFAGSDTSRDIEIISYGKVVIFHKTDKMTAFHDSRNLRPDGTPKPLHIAFAKSELYRMLGCTEGKRAFTLLTCNPATLPQATACPVADEQGIIG